MPKRNKRDLAVALSTKAASDETILEKLWGDADVQDDVLGFHAQQAAEKLIKAVLAAQDLDFPRVHDIGFLLRLLRKHDVSEPPDAAELEALTPWAAEFRYEDTLGKAFDRERAIATVRNLRSWADEQLRH